ncbi:hypothetical protein HHI36_020409 [Cryptolaemus montrouzieri]|uniref:Uncharacterized protein n=1 Tax=Cryptolaemus montrouzieri TaxID=559131 RepID=A0ABD2NAF2_9CUCU
MNKLVIVFLALCAYATATSHHIKGITKEIHHIPHHDLHHKEVIIPKPILPPPLPVPKIPPPPLPLPKIPPPPLPVFPPKPILPLEKKPLPVLPLPPLKKPLPLPL